MDFIYKTQDVGKYMIEMRQAKYDNGYTVSLMYMFDECRGREIKENWYPTRDKANRRFRELVRYAKEVL